MNFKLAVGQKTFFIRVEWHIGIFGIILVQTKNSFVLPLEIVAYAIYGRLVVNPSGKWEIFLTNLEAPVL